MLLNPVGEPWLRPSWKNQIQHTKEHLWQGPTTVQGRAFLTHSYRHCSGQSYLATLKTLIGKGSNTPNFQISFKTRLVKNALWFSVTTLDHLGCNIGGISRKSNIRLNCKQGRSSGLLISFENHNKFKFTYSLSAERLRTPQCNTMEGYINKLSDGLNSFQTYNCKVSSSLPFHGSLLPLLALGVLKRKSPCGPGARGSCLNAAIFPGPSSFPQRFFLGCLGHQDISQIICYLLRTRLSNRAQAALSCLMRSSWTSSWPPASLRC